MPLVTIDASVYFLECTSSVDYLQECQERLGRVGVLPHHQMNAVEFLAGSPAPTTEAIGAYYVIMYLSQERGESNPYEDRLGAS